MKPSINPLCEAIGPKLAALLLGELEGQDKIETERHLAECADCQREMTELRAATEMLEERFAAEHAQPALSERRVAELAAGNVQTVQAAPATASANGHRKWTRIYWFSGTAAAAAAAVAAFVMPSVMESYERSQVSRVKSDQRSLATTLESSYREGSALKMSDSPSFSPKTSTDLDRAARAAGSRDDRPQGPEDEPQTAESQPLPELGGAVELNWRDSGTAAQAGEPQVAMTVVGEKEEAQSSAEPPARQFGLDSVASPSAPAPAEASRSSRESQQTGDAALQQALERVQTRQQRQRPGEGIAAIRSGRADSGVRLEGLESARPALEAGRNRFQPGPEATPIPFQKSTAPSSPAALSASTAVSGDPALEAQKEASYTVSYADEKDIAFAPGRTLSTRIYPPHPTPALPNAEQIDMMYFQNYGVNPFIETAEDPQSTFAIDVDKASYAVARNYLNRGVLPPHDAVRVEEFVNYFSNRYAPPRDSTFAVYSEMAPSPFRPGYHVLKVGIKGKEITREERKPVVLTFVIDVSGSMQREDRLELVKRTLHRLVNELKPNDQIGIAIYGSNGMELMRHTYVSQADAIRHSINQLHPSGSTNAEEGLEIGYAMARRAFERSATNRVILCSDGVANVGQTGPDQILRVIEENAGDNIYLTTLGFGMGNYNDVLMEQLANKGNGHYAYLDTDDEARRFIEKDLLGSMQVIAQDVKIQVEFDPNAVAKYRLLGYENRDVRDQDFRNDKVDAGEIGAGHAVTALYELKLAEGGANDVATVRLRFKQPDAGMAVKEIAGTIGAREVTKPFAQTDEHFKLVTCAAQAAEILRRSYWAKEIAMADVIRVFDEALGRRPSDAEAADFRDLLMRAEPLVAAERPRPTETPSQADPRREFNIDERSNEGAIEMKEESVN